MIADCLIEGHLYAVRWKQGNKRFTYASFAKNKNDAILKVIDQLIKEQA